MKQAKTIRLFVILVFLLPAVAYVLISWYEKKIQSLPVYGTTKKENGRITDHHVGNFLFTNQDGKPISSDQWNDRIVISNFFFTHCPVICPKMTINLKKIQEVFGKDEEIITCSFSVDPERDSARQLKVYADKFDINSLKWQLLTGDKKELYRFARNELQIVATDGDGGPGDFIHSDKLVLIDKQKRIRGYYDGTSEEEVKQLITDIKKLKDEN